MFFPAVLAGLITQASFCACASCWLVRGSQVCLPSPATPPHNPALRSPQLQGHGCSTALLVPAGVTSLFSVRSTSCSFDFPLLNTRRLQEQKGAVRQTTGRRVSIAAAINPTGIPRLPAERTDVQPMEHHGTHYHALVVTSCPFSLFIPTPALSESRQK